MRARFIAVVHSLILSLVFVGPARARVQDRCALILDSTASIAARRASSPPRNLLSKSRAKPLQVFVFEGTRYLMLDLGLISEGTSEYRLAAGYLYRDYPELMRRELNKDESFIREMNSETAKDWNRIKLFLAVNPDGPVTSVTGGLAFIISRGSHESLPAVEKLKGVTGSPSPLPSSFYPAAEIGRTGAFGTPHEKSRRFAQLVRLGHQVAKAESGIAEFLVFTKTSLLVFYEREVPVERLANLPPENPESPRLHDIVGRFVEAHP